MKKIDTEILEYLEGTATTEEVLVEIDAMEWPNLDEDPEFMAEVAKGQITEDILQAMQYQNISKSALANKLGKSRQYISRVLNERANFTIDSLAEIACALDQKIDLRIIARTKQLIEINLDDYITTKSESVYFTSFKKPCLLCADSSNDDYTIENNNNSENPNNEKLLLAS